MTTHPKITTAFLTAIALLALYASSRAAEPTEGLISHWAFDEGQGYTASDATGRNDGTIYGAQWTTGLIDNALNFDGHEDYVRVGDKDSLDFGASKDFTIAAWFKTSAVSAQMIVNDRVKGKKAGYDFYISGGRMFARITDGPRGFIAQSPEQSYNDNEWHHAAAVFDRTDVITIYVDGEVVAASPPISELGDIDNDQAFAIGGRLYSTTAAYFKGPLDDVRVYGRTLSPEEIQWLYQAAFIPVVALEITGPDRVRENSSAQFTAIAAYQDGSTQDVTAQATWSAEPQDCAAIDNSGLLTTQRIETADQITVSAQYTRNGVTVDAQLIVGVTALVDLQITGPHQVAENSSAQYQATAYYEDGSAADVTPSATWSVDPQDVAAISESGHLNTGRIETETALTIYADYTVAASALQAQAAVQAAQPIALEITGRDELPGGFHTQYDAKVTYEDDSTADVTASAVWSVEPQDYATIDEYGFVSAAEVNQPQDITIFAQYTSAAVTVDAQMLVRVMPPRLLRVPSEYQTIQAAIDDALDGDIVLVAPGTYTGEGNRDIYLAKTVTVRSESGPQNTIIDCNASRRDDHGGFDFHTTADVGPALDGLTITNAYRGDGGAIYAHGTDFTINNCIFTRNSGEKTRGGAIYCEYGYGDYGSPRITNCTFTANSANYGGAAMYFLNAAPIIDNCVITDNRARDGGGGIRAHGSTVTITNCVITGNSAEHRAGGGISARDSTVTITNCSILSNSTKRGGGGIDYHSYYGQESLTITNSVIAGNSAQNQDGWYAAGIYCHNRFGTSIIANSTITENCPAGIYCHGAIEITNCILWANSPGQIYYDGEYRPTVTYSDVQGAWSGEGNIDADPRFVRPAESGPCRVEGDYHLLPTSPCIDAAKDAGVYTDMDGTPRPFDYPDIDNNAGLADFDMGAYEAFILPPYDRAVDRVTRVLDRQAELLELIDEFLTLQWEAYDALDELLDTGDYTDAPKADIVSARQKIYSAMRHHEQSADAFEKGIEKLNDSLTSLGAQPEPNHPTSKELIE